MSYTQTLVTSTTLTREGVLVSAQNSDETNGNYLALTGYELIEIKNNDSSPRSVTFVAQSTDPRGNKVNLTKSVTNAVTHVFGPFQKADWADANGNMLISWSAGTSTNCAMRIMTLLCNNPSSATE